MSWAGPAWSKGLAGLLAGVGLLGCGGSNSLSGSVEELFPLDVSRVEVLRNAEALQVSYYRNAGQDVDLVVRLTLATEGLDLRPGKKVNLAGTTEAGTARATVVHLSAGEPARLLGPVDKGDLSLDEGGEIGQSTSGDFSLSFQRGDSYGAGRSLEGRFTAVAQDAGFGPEPLPPGGLLPLP
ncbi:hypothetical protein [Stigmatella aurantiaca]|uniref:Conserved uncharacterized protein n=1 Tax=Stigmatella aurantiaca (strain DW4/3-1) TaxID=378806 RepID=Q097G7_STIAD|nr:hypothetical protein [Stigmatella aurantiaca]ADO69868.1 conserved uncharacterized protein [Stigmatella aurantiaca DW4/3-1]EAU67899.1 hypothetical protein STIAU_2293 [Stigmatella aurantiaca DW4/3-1]